MKHRSQTKIIAFVGLAGSGKTSAVNYLSAKQYPKIYFGGVIYQAMRDANIEITWDSQKIFREEIRKREGNDFVVKQAVVKARNLIESGQHRIILDGLYSWSEYRILKHEFPGELTVVAVVTPKYLRYRRMANRAERPMQPHEVDQRDWAEIENLEKGGPIAMADYFIINDRDVESYNRQIDDILKAIDF